MCGGDALLLITAVKNRNQSMSWSYMLRHQRRVRALVRPWLRSVTMPGHAPVLRRREAELVGNHYQYIVFLISFVEVY
jgi:hypothetical protein